jgi:large subunit ribosomal protein L20
LVIEIYLEIGACILVIKKYMARVKRGVAASKRRKNVLSAAKGFRWRRSKNYAAAKEALLKAGKYAHRDRRKKKGINRSLWILRLNNALRQQGLTYSKFISVLKSKKIEIDRKTLSQLAVENPDIFVKFVEKIK